MENEQVAAADYEQLLLAPKSVGSHFVFSNEKNWNLPTDDDPSLFGGQHFRFNLADFERQMATIPFYVRQGYDPNLFSDDELANMRRESELAPRSEAMGAGTVQSKEPIRVDAINKHILSILKEKNDDTVGLADSPAVIHIANEEIAKKVDVDELDELLDLVIKDPVDIKTNATSVRAAPIVSGPAPVNDIQQWLDDILDD